VKRPVDRVSRCHDDAYFNIYIFARHDQMRTQTQTHIVVTFKFASCPVFWLHISPGDGRTDWREILHDGTRTGCVFYPFGKVPPGIPNPKFAYPRLAGGYCVSITYEKRRI